MDVKVFAQTVEMMRIAQNNYFRYRRKEDLEKSKRLEETVDLYVKHILHPEQDAQQKLF